MRFVSWAALVLGFVAALSPTMAAADDIADVRRLLDQGRTFDAFMELRDLAPTGEPEAQYMLGGMYHWGDAGPADFTKAREWYGRAARQGHADAMIGLAILDAQGTSEKENKQAAFTWLTIAAALTQDPQTQAKVAALRDKLKSELNEAELSAALAEAMAFTPQPEAPSQ
jgi:TPR repeat protein